MRGIRRGLALAAGVLGILVGVVGTLGMGASATVAEGTRDIPEAAQATAPEPIAPDGYVLFAMMGMPMSVRVLVPKRFAMEALRVIPCESSWDASLVGLAGERGLLQVHPLHDARMRQLGLDPLWEPARIWFAGNYLWPRSGWAPWSCRTVLEH